MTPSGIPSVASPVSSPMEGSQISPSQADGTASFTPSTCDTTRHSNRTRFTPSAMLGKACLLAAIALHWVVLGLPMPGQNAPTTDPLPEEQEEEEGMIEGSAIAVIPKADLIPTPPAPSIPSPPLVTEPSMTPVASALSRPVPAPQHQLPPPAQTPEPPPLPHPTPEPTPVDSPPVPAAPEPSFYGDFPHLEGAEATCNDRADCWRSPAENWRSAATTLKERLENQGYILTNITGEVLGVDTGVRVYSVSQAGKDTYYLNLVSVVGGMLYTLTPEPITLETLSALQQI